MYYGSGKEYSAEFTGAEEDDGVLLSVVLDAKTERSMLVVLDAKTLEEEARAEMGTHVPYGFHGAWVGKY